MALFPARMCVFPRSGFKKHDAIPNSASTKSQRADAVGSHLPITRPYTPGIDFSIQIDPRHFKKPDNN